MSKHFPISRRVELNDGNFRVLAIYGTVTLPADDGSAIELALAPDFGAADMVLEIATALVEIQRRRRRADASKAADLAVHKALE
jgi:hypothetical protein